MEKQGKEFIERQITQLKTQLEATTDRCYKLQLQSELSISENQTLNASTKHYAYLREIVSFLIHISFPSSHIQ